MSTYGLIEILLSLGIFILMVYVCFRLIRGVFRRLKKSLDMDRRKREEKEREEARKKAEAEKQERMIELVRLRKESAEAEERMRAAERERELEDKDILQRSTVTINGKTVSVADIVSEKVARETGRAPDLSAGSTERLSMARVKCVQCGASIEEGSMFCRFCGTKVPDNVFWAEININDTARMKAEELKHEREKKLTYRFTEAQKAIAQNVEAHAEKIRARSEEKRIEYEEKARKERLEAEERERKFRDKQAEANRAMIKLFAGIMIFLLGSVFLLWLIGHK